MANEATIINNPDFIPAAVSSGYQRQNTLLTSLFNGIDYTVVEGGVGEVTVKISGPIDVNGVLYSIASDAVLTMVGAAGNYCIYLDGAGATLTPTLSAVGVLGTFDPSKNARYTAGGKRILNWLIYYDGTDAYVTKWVTPESDNNYILDLDQPAEAILTSNGNWTAPRSKFYDILITGKGGNGGNAINSSGSYTYLISAGGGGAAATGKKRIFIKAGTVWTATFNTGSGANTTFSDGVTTLSIQNGYDASNASGAGSADDELTISAGGIGGSSSSGMDKTIYGGDGHAGAAAEAASGNSYYIVGGNGGASFYGGGGKGQIISTYLTSALGENKAYGSGGGGASRRVGGGTNTGGAGKGGIICIIG